MLLTSTKESLPGAAPILAARMLAQIGDNRQRYGDYQALQCEASTAPVTIASGNYSYVRFRRACKKPLRAALHQFAFCSRRETDWANQFYQQHREKGKSNSLATRALANKWVSLQDPVGQGDLLPLAKEANLQRELPPLGQGSPHPQGSRCLNRTPHLDIESVPSEDGKACSCRDGVVGGEASLQESRLDKVCSEKRSP